MLPTFGIFLKMLQIRTKNQKKMPYNIGNKAKFSPVAHRESWYDMMLLWFHNGDEMCSTFFLGFLSNCKKIIIFEFSTEKYFLKGFFFYIFSVEKNVEKSVEKNVEANFRKKKVWCVGA